MHQLHNALHWLNHRLHAIVASDRMHELVHCTYLGFTWWEGHGGHAIAAGVLLLMVIGHVFLGGD
jgi:hypothetical protein